MGIHVLASLGVSGTQEQGGVSYRVASPGRVEGALGNGYVEGIGELVAKSGADHGPSCRREVGTGRGRDVVVRDLVWVGGSPAGGFTVLAFIAKVVGQRGPVKDDGLHQ